MKRLFLLVLVLASFAIGAYSQEVISNYYNNLYENLSEYGNGYEVISPEEYNTDNYFDNYDPYAYLKGASNFGSAVWKQNYGSNGDDAFNQVISDGNGGWVAVGTIGSGLYGKYDGFVMWVDQYGNKKKQAILGGSGNDFLEGIVKLKDGGYIVVGRSQQTSIGNGTFTGLSVSGNRETAATIVRLDANLKVSKAEVFYYNGATAYNSVAQLDNDDDDIVAVGYSYTNYGGKSARYVVYDKLSLVIKADDRLNYSHSEYTYESFQKVIDTEDGGFLCVGAVWGTNIDVDTTRSGSGCLNGQSYMPCIQKINYSAGSNSYSFGKNWTTAKYFNSFFNDVVETKDYYVAVGFSKKLDGSNANGIVYYFPKDLSTISDFFEFNCPGTNNIRGITRDKDNGIILAGSLTTSCFGSDVFENISSDKAAGSDDAFLIRCNYNSSKKTYEKSNIDTVITFGGSDSDSFRSVVELDNTYCAVGAAGNLSTTDGWSGLGGGKDAIAVEFNIPVSKVSVTPKTLSLKVGQTAKLSATVYPSNATDKAISWSTMLPKDRTIIDLDYNGNVTAKAVGEAEVLVLSVDGIHGDICYVTVTADTKLPESVTVSPTEKTIGVDDTFIITPTILPSNATNKNVTWKSDYPAYVTVDSTGKVTGVKVGVANITCTTVDGAKTATCKVTVKYISPTGVTVSPTSKTIKVAETFVVTPTVLPSNATNKSVTWKSSNTAVATVDANGKVTGVKAGTATITCTTVDGAKTATCAVTVTSVPDIPIDNIVISPTPKAIKVGQTIAYTLTILPSNATNKTITLGNSNTSVATATLTGTTVKITGVKAGITNITITAGGKTVTFSQQVDPADVLPTGVTVSPKSIVIKKGANMKLTATVAPSNATNKSVTWSSSNIRICTVDSTGKVTGAAIGSTLVKVTTSNGKTATCKVTVR